jgi:hypothetical protein
MGHLVVGTSQLEAEHGLLILTLEQDLTFKAVAQVDGVDQRDLVTHLSDPGVRGDDESQVLWPGLVTSRIENTGAHW